MTFELAAHTRSADYEDRLAIEARDGNHAAFDELVRRYEARLYRFAYRMLQHPCDAEDVLQATFLRAYRALEAYKPGGFFASWLYRIALNECRRKIRGRKVSLPGGVELAQQVPAGPATDPEALALRHDRNRHIRGAVMSLPEHYRDAILLFYFEELSVEEVARTMGITVTAAKVRLHRARAKLLAALDGDV